MLFNIASLEAISEIIKNPTWDILAVFFFIAFGFFYGLSAGRKRLLAVLFALYVSILVFSNFFYLDGLLQNRSVVEIFAARFAVFLLLFVMMIILFSKQVFFGSGKTEKWWQIFLLSFLEVGLFMSAIFQFLPAKDLFDFSPLVENIFASDSSFFYWLALPILSLLFIVKKRNLK